MKPITHRKAKRLGAMLLVLGLFCGAMSLYAQNGSSWVLMDSGTTAALRDISVYDSANIVAVGYNDPTVLRYDGTAWSEMAGSQAPWGPTGQLTSVVAIAPDDIWVGSSDNPRGAIHWDGTAWSEEVMNLSGYRVQSFWVDSSDFILAGHNTRGTLSRWDGNAWTLVRSYDQGAPNLNRIDGTGLDNIWAGDTAGNILHSTDILNQAIGNETFSIVATLPAFEVNSAISAIQMASETSVWVTTSKNGVVGHWDGTELTTWVPWGTTAWNDIYVASDESVWIVGNSGRIAYYDGTEWSRVNHGLTTDALHGIDMDEMGNLYVVGSNGFIMSTIPEPGTLAILLVSALLVLGRKMR